MIKRYKVKDKETKDERLGLIFTCLTKPIPSFIPNVKLRPFVKQAIYLPILIGIHQYS